MSGKGRAMSIRPPVQFTFSLHTKKIQGYSVEYLKNRSMPHVLIMALRLMAELEPKILVYGYWSGSPGNSEFGSTMGFYWELGQTKIFRTGWEPGPVSSRAKVTFQATVLFLSIRASLMEGGCSRDCDLPV
jgi:hypothetical protein